MVLHILFQNMNGVMDLQITTLAEFYIGYESLNYRGAVMAMIVW